MAFANPLSIAGFDADLAALVANYNSQKLQLDMLRTLIQHHYTTNFIPAFLVEDVKKAAFPRGLDRDINDTLTLVGLIGAFQRFVKVLVSDILATYRAAHATFGSLDQKLQQRYLSAAASTFRFKSSGTVKGVRVNFQSVQQSLKSCLADEADYTLEGDSITSEFSNPNCEAIKALLEKVNIEWSASDASFGQNLLDAGWEPEASATSAASSAESLITKSIKRRNDAVHGLERVVFNQDEIIDLCAKFSIIGNSLFNFVNARV